MLSVRRLMGRFTPLALASGCAAVFAQPVPPSPPFPPGPEAPPAPAVTPDPGIRVGPRETPSPSDAPARSISPRPGTPIAKGTVNRLLLNAEGNIDGLMLADGTQVRFPPHMSQELGSTVKPGDPVSIEGYREAGGAVRGRVITDQATGRSVVEHDPSPPTVSPNLRSTELAPLSAQGRIRQLLRDPAGDVNGVVLEDGSIVRFAPDVRRQYPGVLQPGNPISASGYGKQTRFGRALDATSLGAGERRQPLTGAAPGTPGAPR